MRILVLGGTVFLSAEIVRRALAAGHEVTCLARGAVSAPPDGASWLRADRSEGAAAYSAACKGAASDGAWDAVVDVSRDPGQAREALEALAGSARHWTFISSCSVYADHSVAGADEAAGVLPPAPARDGAQRRELRRSQGRHRALDHGTRWGQGPHLPGRAHRRPGRRLGPLRVLAGPLRPGPGPRPGAGHPHGRHPDHRRP